MCSLGDIYWLAGRTKNIRPPFIQIDLDAKRLPAIENLQLEAGLIFSNLGVRLIFKPSTKEVLIVASSDIYQRQYIGHKLKVYRHLGLIIINLLLVIACACLYNYFSSRGVCIDS